MRVLHIISGDLTGGAAKGAYWLHRALVELNIDSKIWTNSKITYGDNTVYSIIKNKKDKFLDLLRSQIDGLPQILYPNRKNVIFSTGFIGVDFTKSLLYKNADIIHLHWINLGLVNIKHLSKINKPIVWTIRDMWPFTGGCHYSLECENYKIKCGYCKQLNSKSKNDLSRIVIKRKEKYFPKHIQFVGISNWLTNEAKKSYLLKNRNIITIHNNISTDDFFPINKFLARQILGISTQKKIILCGAHNIELFYKGFNKFIEAVSKLDRNKIFLLFFGKLENLYIIKNLDFEYKSFGFLYDMISLRLVYSASDVFVAPSLMDAFGKTLAESMACGTPVVAFDATGPKDIISHKVDGYLARPYDTDDLARGIEWILNNPNYQKLAKNAREKVVREFDSKVIARKYIQLYKEILNRR